MSSLDFVLVTLYGRDYFDTLLGNNPLIDKILITAQPKFPQEDVYDCIAFYNYEK